MPLAPFSEDCLKSKLMVSIPGMLGMAVPFYCQRKDSNSDGFGKVVQPSIASSTPPKNISAFPLHSRANLCRIFRISLILIKDKSVIYEYVVSFSIIFSALVSSMNEKRSSIDDYIRLEVIGEGILSNVLVEIKKPFV